MKVPIYFMGRVRYRNEFVRVVFLAKKFGIDPVVLGMRLRKGWTLNRALMSSKDAADWKRELQSRVKERKARVKANALSRKKEVASKRKQRQREKKRLTRKRYVYIPTPDGPMCVTHAARKYGLHWLTLRKRIKAGWPAETLFIAPFSQNRMGVRLKTPPPRGTVRGNKPVIQLAGQRFGKLLVIERVLPNHRLGYARWRCKCDCGGEKIVWGVHLRKKKVISCGCAWKAILIKKGERRNRFGRHPLTRNFLAHPAKQLADVKWVKDNISGRIYGLVVDKVGRVLLMDAEQPSLPPMLVRMVDILEEKRFIQVASTEEVK